ncbi:MAG: response regulator [Gemmatimonadales bacterium]
MTNVPKGRIRPGTTIVVLENDTIILQSTARSLRREGYDVYEAETPAEARIIVDGLRKPVALLLCDLDLNGIHGRDAANALQALRPEMRVLFMSGGDSIQFRRDLERTERLYLKKPFDNARLLELVALKLEGWKPAANQ